MVNRPPLGIASTALSARLMNACSSWGEQAKGGKLFVLAQLFLDIDDALVEPRFFDGDGGQLGERREDADLFVGELVRLAGIDAQRPKHLTRKDQGHADQRHQTLLARD